MTNTPGGTASGGAGGAPVQTIQTFDFQILPDHNELTIYSGLNEASWGDVVSVGTSILDRLEQARTAKLLVDLSQLNYMGSSQVALLVRVWKVVKARDGKLAVHVKSDIVHKVLTIAGLHTLWDIVPTRAAAQRALGVRVTPDRKPVNRLAGDCSDEETQNETASQDVSPVLISLAVVFAAFLVLVLGQSHIWPGSSQIRLAILMVLSGLSVMCGVWSTTKVEGPLRTIGLGICLAGFVMGISAALEWPRSPLSPAPSAGGNAVAAPSEGAGPATDRVKRSARKD